MKRRCVKGLQQVWILEGCAGPSCDPGWSKGKCGKCAGKLWFLSPKKGPFNQFGDVFFFQGQAATYLLNKGIVRKVRSLSLQLVGRKLRVLAVRKTPSFEGQFRNSKF